MMDERLVRLRRIGEVALLTLDRPPANALDAALRDTLARRLEEVAADAEVRAVVLTGAGETFSTGTDLRELETGPTAPAPDLSAICTTLEQLRVPVVAALNGAALGGGAELALAAHWRLAVPRTVIGLPDISLGLVPAAGGTQRLARLAGARVALAMLLSGKPVEASQAQGAGIIDGIVEGDAASAGVALAQALIAEGKGPRPASTRRERLSDGAGWLAEAKAARGAASGSAGTAFTRARVIDCVEAALILPYAAGLDYERTAWEDCHARPETRALTHLFLAERRASPRLIARDGGRPTLTVGGMDLADRLGAAVGEAAAALAQAGVPEDEIDGAAVAAGFPAGPFGGTEAADSPGPLWRRLVAATAAEGARAIASGAAPGPGDVDAVAALGLAWPRASGGPMHAAQAMDLPRLVAEMAEWDTGDGLWEVPPLMAQAATRDGDWPLAPAG